MEAATPMRTEPLDETTAVEIWRECRRIALDVSLVQATPHFESELKASGRERDQEYLRVSIRGDLSGSQVKMIQAIAASSGREVTLDSGSLRIY